MLGKRHIMAYSYSHSFSVTTAKSSDGGSRGRRKSKLTSAHSRYEDIASIVPDAGVPRVLRNSAGNGLDENVPSAVEVSSVPAVC